MSLNADSLLKTLPRAALFLVLFLAGCGPSEKSQIRHAYEVAFPGGHPMCFGVSFANNLPDEPGTVFFPSSGITSPVRHLFVFYVAPSNAPVPEYVKYFQDQDLIQRHDVTATMVHSTSADGPQMISPAGIYYHNTIFQHTFSTFPVSIYTTAPQDPRFSFEPRNPNIPMFDSGYLRSRNTPVFLSRVYDNKLPPPDVDYTIPLMAPYTISLVTGECYNETLDRITDVQQVQSPSGNDLVEADVLLDPHAPDYMKTAIFRRAANPSAGSVPSLDSPRETKLLFQVVSGKLHYLEEADQ